MRFGERTLLEPNPYAALVVLFLLAGAWVAVAAAMWRMVRD